MNVKVIRSDNGREFLNKQFENLIAKKGKFHQTISLYTPQQNLVKRKNRHLLEAARASGIHAHLPKKFWPECVLAAAHIVNRLPVQSLKWLTSNELLYGRKPTYNHLRVIGCLPFAYNVAPRREKMETMAIKSVLLGYSDSQKGYRLYNLVTRKLFVSRDVKFF